jgi:hypothetical protein
MIATLKDYRRITKDMTSYDGDILIELTAAQNYVEDFTERKFESATRAETLYQYSDGKVYPSATPIISVDTPVDATIIGNAISTFVYAFPDPIINWHSMYTISNVYSLSRPERPTIDVVYTGGYEEGQIPEDIIRIVCKIANLSLNTSLIQVPAGATSIKTGDVQILGKDLGDTIDVPASIIRTLRAWRRQEPRGGW